MLDRIEFVVLRADLIDEGERTSARSSSTHDAFGIDEQQMLELILVAT